MLSNNSIQNIWPEWQIDSTPLGKGAYGVVYKAARKDHNIESYAAIKVISIPSNPSEIDSLRAEGLNLDESRTYLQNIVNDFVSEIQLMESIKGTQNIVSVEDYKVVEKTDSIGWDIYIRMELLTPFNSYKSAKTLSQDTVIKLGCDICSALEICNQRNIIHRDIKPENIFVNDFGHFKLGDFGIARQLENMSVSLSRGKGTPNYMAPEVFNGDSYDSRADIYSLGLVLYFLMNGNRLPFWDDKKILSPAERENALKRRCHGETIPAPCHASPEMADLILRACAFDPQMRFASAAEMKQALLAVSSGTYVIFGAIDPDKTAVVRKAAHTAEQVSEPKVNTFGDAQGEKRKLSEIFTAIIPAAKKKLTGLFAAFVGVIRKNRKLAIILAAALATLLIIGIVVGIALSSENDPGTKDPDQTTEQDDQAGIEELILPILAAADALAENGNYEGAIQKLQAGLAAYPKAQRLLQKVEEYTKALNIQVKGEILKAAEEFAANKDYKSAISALLTAIAEHPNDSEYSTAYNTYYNALKKETIATAASYAEQNDYDSALGLLLAAMNEYPDDSEYSAVYNGYYSSLKQGILAAAAAYVNQRDYESALALFESVMERFAADSEFIQKYESYYAAFRSFILDQADAFANNADYESALSIVEAVLERFVDDTEFAKKYEIYYDALRITILEKAEALKNNHEYELALQVIEAVMGRYADDSKLLQAYKTCYAAFKDFVLNKATAFINNADYESALALIESVMERFAEDSEVVQKYESHYAAFRNSILDKAEAFANDKDYGSALALIESVMGRFAEDSKVTQEYESHYTAFKNSILDEAEAFVSNNDYRSALALIESVTERFAEDSEVAQIYDDYYATFKKQTLDIASHYYVNDEECFDALEVLTYAQAAYPEDKDYGVYYTIIKQQIQEFVAECIKNEDYDDAMEMCIPALLRCPADQELLNCFTSLKDHMFSIGYEHDFLDTFGELMMEYSEDPGYTDYYAAHQEQVLTWIWGFAEYGYYHYAYWTIQSALAAHPEDKGYNDCFVALKEDTLEVAEGIANMQPDVSYYLLYIATYFYPEDTELAQWYKTYYAAYKKHVLDEAAWYANIREYARALQIIEEILEYSPEDAELTQQYKMYHAAYKKYVLDEAALYAKIESYNIALMKIDAFCELCGADPEITALREEILGQIPISIDKALKEAADRDRRGDFRWAYYTIHWAIVDCGETSELTAAAEKYGELYVQKYAELITQRLAEKQYEEAEEDLEIALNWFPEDQRLLTLKNKLDPWIMDIDKLTVLDGNFDWGNGNDRVDPFEDNTLDPFGSNYYDADNYVIFHAEELVLNQPVHVKYQLDHAYTDLVFTVAPGYDAGENGSFEFRVYADDVWIYRLQGSSLATWEEPYSSSVDISGASTITLEFLGTGGNYCTVLSNVVLKTHPDSWK